MKVKTVIELDTSTGSYEIQFFSHKKEHTKIDQSELVRLLRKVIEDWDKEVVIEYAN